ncbi:hypothetical protein H7F13_03665 [Proteus vulgaris]|nr:hypothetical protein H7F13_03665 [Proteus vulgaris]
MIIKKNTFEPNILFLNKQHSFPKKECYIFTKNISEIKNTPVAPSFTKRLIHGVISLFHKIEIFFLIKEIKNNKLSGVVDIKKHIKSFDEINVIEDKTINNNLNTVKNIISHANDKFDFYSYCNYLTEVKRAKDFFSSLNNEGDEGGKNKLIVDVLNEIIKNRINALDDKSIKNILKLIFLKFKFENIHLNEKYDFMSNFSTEKERGNFIKSMNFLLISIEEVQLFDKFDNNIKNEVESKLSAIMMIALNKKSDSEYSFDSLMQEWKEKYISDHDNVTKSDVIEETDIRVNTDISHDIEVETIIEIARQAPKEDLSAKYIDIDNFNVDDYQLILRNKIDNIKKTDEKNNSELDEYKSTLDSDIDNTKEISESDDLDYQWDCEVSDMDDFDGKELKNNILMEKINKLTLGLKSDEKFNEINNKLESMIHDIEECSAKGGVSFDLDKKLTFSRNNYQLYFDKE